MMKFQIIFRLGSLVRLAKSKGLICNLTLFFRIFKKDTTSLDLGELFEASLA